MTTTTNNEDYTSWYLDTCSNHMIGNRNWLVDLHMCVKNNVKFANNSTIMVEGIAKVLIK